MARPHHFGNNHNVTTKGVRAHLFPLLSPAAQQVGAAALVAAAAAAPRHALVCTGGNLLVDTYFCPIHIYRTSYEIRPLFQIPDFI